MYALRADDGELRWRHELRPDGERRRPDRDRDRRRSSSTARSSSAGTCTTATTGEPAGVLALDAATGEERWTFRTEEGRPAGCGDVWGSPAVDVERRLVFVGTANCPSSPDGLGPLHRGARRARPRHRRAALVVPAARPEQRRLRLRRRAEPVRGRRTARARRPRQQGRRLLRGRPRDRRAGLAAQGGRAGHHRAGAATSRPAASSARPRTPTASSSAAPRSGGDPYLHAIDAATGEIALAAAGGRPRPTRAAVEANGVVFVGGTDFTLRGLDLRTGEVLLAQEMKGVVAGGAVVVGDDVIAVAGIREPGLDERSRTSGVYPVLARRRSRPSRPRPRRPPRTASTIDDRAAPGAAQACVGAPCPFALHLVEPPPGRDAERASSRSPSTRGPVTFRAEGLGAARGVAAARQPGGARTAPTPTPCSCPRATTTRPAGCSACSTRT